MSFNDLSKAKISEKKAADADRNKDKPLDQQTKPAPDTAKK